jgi:hypothetical protein
MKFNDSMPKMKVDPERYVSFFFWSAYLVCLFGLPIWST